MGLILGGVLTQYLSWRYTLFVNLIFAAIAVAGALAYIRSSRPANPPRMDWPGAVLACTGLFLIVFGFSRAETAGWTATLTLGSLILGAVLLTAFVVAEQRSSHPLLPLRVIRGACPGDRVVGKLPFRPGAGNGRERGPAAHQMMSCRAQGCRSCWWEFR